LCSFLLLLIWPHNWLFSLSLKPHNWLALLSIAQAAQPALLHSSLVGSATTNGHYVVFIKHS
jgi:hypothetical protein